MRAFQAARVGMRRVQRFRRCVEHGRSQDDVIRTARAVAEKKIGLLYVCACVRKSSNMSPIASPDLVSSSAMDHDHREPLDRPFKICRFFLQDPLSSGCDVVRWSKKAFEGVPAEHRQLLDALLRGADHGSGHTGQRHGCRRDLFFAYAHNRSPHTVWESVITCLIGQF